MNFTKSDQKYKPGLKGRTLSNLKKIKRNAGLHRSKKSRFL